MKRFLAGVIVCTLSLALINCGGSDDEDNPGNPAGPQGPGGGGGENNEAPVANAGADLEVLSGQIVLLDGSSSTDNDGSIADFQWQQVGGDTISIQNANEEKATFTSPLVDTTLAFRLTVTDNNGVKAFDQKEVSVSLNNAPIDTAHCLSQGAQCGTISDGGDGFKYCGSCSTGESCGDNLCEIADDQSVALQCAMQSAQCGVIRDKLGRSIDCGAPESGEFCVDNRSETKCEPSQFNDGKLDELFAYMPLRFADGDLSPNAFDVISTMYPMEVPKPFAFVSRVNMSAKQVKLDLANKTLPLPMAISFKFMSGGQQESVMLEADALRISQTSEGIRSQFFNDGGEVRVDNNESNLKTASCNHFAAVLNADGITTWLNGKRHSVAANTAGLKALADQLTIGPYPGKVWDVRIYNDGLSEGEVDELGEDCSDKLEMATPHEGYPNYLCGVYACIWWPDNITDTSEENLQYHIGLHDMTWEHNVLTTGMYHHKEFCDGNKRGRDIQLSDGYRKSWVNKFTDSRPVGNFVLHENFHYYQGGVKRGGKFLAESSANWGAYSMKPGTDSNHLLGFYTLQPHMPLYMTQSVPEEWPSLSYYAGGHQYGAGIFEYYLSEFVVGKKFMGDVYNDTSRVPAVEVMYRLVEEAGFDLREVFADFAAKTTTWDYPNGEGFKEAEESSFRRMESVRKKSDTPWPEEEVDNKVIVTHGTEGTGSEWLGVPERYRPGSWGYNAYETGVETDATYTVGVRASTENVEHAEFRARVVVYNEASGARIYHTLNLAPPGEISTIDVAAKAGDKLFLVVATTPSKDFKSHNVYLYDYSIQVK